MFLSKLIRLYYTWRRYHANLRELASLDDRTLADIGLSRCDIDAVARSNAARC